MRDTVEVYVYLHGQRHGVTEVTRTDSIVGKISLPTNLIEFSTAKEKGPGWILLRLPRFLAQEYALVRNPNSLDYEALAREVTRSVAESEKQNPDLNEAGIIPRALIAEPAKRSLLTPVRSTASTHVLDAAKAKSISAQLAEQNLDT